MYISINRTILVLMSTFDAATSLQDRHANTCSIQQKINGPIERHGPSALARVYRKYNKDLPRDVEAIVKNDKNNNDNVITPTLYDMEYLIPVTIGGQTMNVRPDTGSSDLWVFSTHLSRAKQTGHEIYDPSLSNTSKTLTGETWTTLYGDGSRGASGDVCTDTVAVGTFVVQNQAVQLAAKLSSRFLKDTSSNGILGLGFKSLNTVRPDQQNTFFDNVKSSLASPIFTTTLKHQAPGSLDLGYIDATKHTAPISYTKVDNSDGFWDITIDSYIVGKGSAITTGFHGVVDTGAPFLFLDDSVVITYYSQVEGAGYDYTQGGYTFACNTTLPDITFSTNGYDAVVPGKLMSFDAMDNGGTMCFGGLQSNDGLPGNIFGDPLLKSQFVVFDTNGPRMGFAPQA